MEVSNDNLSEVVLILSYWSYLELTMRSIHYYSKQTSWRHTYKAYHIYTRSTCFDWQKRKYITTSRVVSEIQENLQGYVIPLKLSFEKNSLTTNSLQLST